ncbi:hypothetical protein [Chitinophaga lutea]|uniref:hypothetical protein n=1 Tax=Chitinophaga lutea TaxID=2488634 RepID=UPI000F4F7F2E|nr:hypothetical protein [Chitinophaga lutea]
MIRHSLIRQAVIVFAVILLSIPLQAVSQRTPSIMQQKTAALLGKYLISFRSDAGILRYILHIDSVRGVFFYGRMENDLRYHPKRHDFCYIKGVLAERKDYDFVMKPVLTYESKYNLSCAPYEWVLNNKTYFRLDKDVIRGYMLVANSAEMAPFAFSGMRQLPL